MHFQGYFYYNIFHCVCYFYYFFFIMHFSDDFSYFKALVLSLSYQISGLVLQILSKMTIKHKKTPKLNKKDIACDCFV
jgi:hypothetical protein